MEVATRNHCGACQSGMHDACIGGGCTCCTVDPPELVGLKVRVPINGREWISGIIRRVKDTDAIVEGARGLVVTVPLIDLQYRMPTLWTCDPDAENLSCADVDEAVSEWLDDRDGTLPEMLEVYGFAPKVIDHHRLFGRFLEHLLETLDEEYGNIEGDSTKATAEMLSAERKFIEAVVADYKVWQCDQVQTIMVRTADYAE